jgi:ferrous iron transport protein B
MATRSLPSARDRLATMMAAPMMTCSARLPVYVLLISLLVPSSERIGPIGAQGAIMFGLYLLGAVSAMTSAWVFSKIAARRAAPMPFYMEMPSYRLPKAKYVALSVYEACMTFVKKVARIILVVTILLWGLLNLPGHSTAELRSAGVDVTNSAAVDQYRLDNSYAASVGRFVEPVFEPQGFDWRINIGVLSSLAAREVYVATLGQVAAADNPDDPGQALQKMTVQDGPRAGEKLFTPAVIAAILVFFVYALQCVSTIAALRRESGSWKWPAIAFCYMFALAWTLSLLAHTVVGAIWT